MIYEAGLRAYDAEAQGDKVRRCDHSDGGRDDCSYCRGYLDAWRVTGKRAHDCPMTVMRHVAHALDD